MTAMPVNTNGKRVLVALSGGVDSSACVYLLQKAGYTVEAVVLDLFPAAAPTVEAAQQTADLLNIKLHVVTEHKAFLQNVILPFCEEYRMGRTPNPCVMCNPSTKFHFILKAADELGFDYIATGHYASVQCITAEGSERYLLKKSDFLPRDQSYMLYRLGQDVLSRLLLPLQHLTKDEVRAIASEAQLPCASKPDSQEICFIPDNDYPAYIENLLGKLPAGDFIAPDGKPCGKHKGILHYTVGQRKGLGIALGRPVFIKSIDAETNRIYLADSGEEYANGVLLHSCVVHPHPVIADTMHLGVKIRSVAKEAPATVTLLPNGNARVLFDTPQRAPAPGQSVVWYHEDFVVGGGYITEQI